MMKKLLIVILSLPLFSIQLYSQMISTDPAVPTMGQVIKIFFDAKSNDAGELKNYTGDLYAHTGVTIGGVNWKNVIGTWGVNSTQPKLTYLGNSRYELEIKPGIKEFYSLTASETATKICLVIRSADGTRQTRPDIFIDVFASGLNVTFTLPVKFSSVAELNAQIPVKVDAAAADSVSLYLNGKWIKHGTSATSLTHTFSADNYGEFWMKAVAWDLPKSASDSCFIYVRKPLVTENLPAGISDGINYLSDTSVALVLHAPYKKYVFAVGDFNGWRACEKGYLKRTPDGERYWAEIRGLKRGKEYRFQYLVDSSLYIADPYSEKLLDPSNDQYINSSTYPGLISYPKDTASGIVSILQTAGPKYAWSGKPYQPPLKSKLVIYEMLIRDFVATHKFSTITDTLNYLQKLGINAIELMPVTEFEGNLSWGYNVSFLFAPDKYYGPGNSLKELIDSCHNRGIAVILDMVLNHSFGQSPFVQLYLNYYAADEIVMKLPNPWFNAISPNRVYKWGADFNHESSSTQKLVDRVTSFWLNEYKVDGFRFDFTKGFTNTAGDGGAYDASRISILRRMADKIWQVNPNAYVILEHLAANTEEKVLADYGMLLWGNMNYQYCEASLGHSSDLTWGVYKARDWVVPNLITYMESHDEERVMYVTLTSGASGTGYNVKELNTALLRMELYALFLLTLPGPKMIWQFGELGYDKSINLNGRTGEKPILWNYYSIPQRYRLYTFYSILNKLKKTEEVFSTSDLTYSLAGNQKSIQLNSAGMNVNILGNFDFSGGNISPSFQQPGKWYEYFTDDSITVANVNDPILLKPGEYRMYTTRRLKSPKKILGTDDLAYPSGDLRAKAYPNPSDSHFSFEVSNTTPDRITLTIYDISGRTIYQARHDLTGNSSDLFEWDGKTSYGEDAQRGVYLARIVTGKGSSITLRIIKK